MFRTTRQWRGRRQQLMQLQLCVQKRLKLDRFSRILNHPSNTEGSELIVTPSLDVGACRIFYCSFFGKSYGSYPYDG
ncbi:hypothetical protein MTBPR1_100015 [Candidatus Terasakiella magnetica]|uniref:Uncharacterized protein n=1 Tax=Candidatus Terasakiella magnetica TaxID=1867952 RepID=A0A1C3RDT4_9PROT|nr:hypothetical protein MTBPR1_100015 [Candidatus Terasakiella magnetica]